MTVQGIAHDVRRVGERVSSTNTSFALCKVLALIIGILLMGEGSAQNAPDFSEVQSRDAAAELAADGKLVKMLLFPAVFGGEDIAHNTVYVTPATGDLMDQITGTLVRFFEEGLIDQLSVSPTYRGDSFVPGSIVIKAWHTERDGSLEHTIEVW